MARKRLDVKEAAQVLGISTDAVHKRARRGSLESDKDEEGRVFVWIDTEESVYTQDSQNVHPLLMSRLENENDFLRRELERRAEELAEMRRIVAGLVQRVPELESAKEAPTETRDSRETPSKAAGNGDGRAGPEHRSWWLRLFGG